MPAERGKFAAATYAGVLGKMIGVYLGRPVEGWAYEAIRERFGEVDGYVHEALGLPLVVADDDLSGSFGFFRALEDSGYAGGVTAADFGDTWLNTIIEDKTILWWGGFGRSTEHTAYLRLKAGYRAPHSGSSALNGAMLSTQIGAQIFTDPLALMSPGDPEQAGALIRTGGVGEPRRRGARLRRLPGRPAGAGLRAPGAGGASGCRRAVRVRRSASPPAGRRARHLQPRARLAAGAGLARSALRLRRVSRPLPDSDQPRDGAGLLAARRRRLPPGGDHRRLRRLRHRLQRRQRGLPERRPAGAGGHSRRAARAGRRPPAGGHRRGRPLRQRRRAERPAVSCRPGRHSGASPASRTSPASGAAPAPRTSAGSPDVAGSRDVAGVAPAGWPRFGFELPGARQGFAPCPHAPAGTAPVRVAGSDDPGVVLYYRDVTAVAPARVSTPVFLDFDEVADNFSTHASPTLYATQEVTVRLEAPPPATAAGTALAVAIYALYYDDADRVQELRSSAQTLRPGANTLRWQVPANGGMPLFRIGLELAAPPGGPSRLAGSLRLLSVDWDGAPRDFRQRGMLMSSIWNLRPALAARLGQRRARVRARLRAHLLHLAQRRQRPGNPRHPRLARLRGGDAPPLQPAPPRRPGAARPRPAALLRRRVQRRRPPRHRRAPQRRRVHPRAGLVRLRDGAPVCATYFAAAGDRLSLTVDGTPLLETRDDRYPSGGAGFVIDEGTMLADGFRVRRKCHNPSDGVPCRSGESGRLHRLPSREAG